jgi:hypothetical protein
MSTRGIIRAPAKSQSKEYQFLLRQAGPDGVGTVTQTRFPDDVLKNNNQSEHHNFNTAARAGVGVGVMFVVFLLAGVLLVYWNGKGRVLSEQSQGFLKAELPGGAVPLPKKEVFEIGEDERKELEESQSRTQSDFNKN